MTLLPDDIIATGTPSGIALICPGVTVEIKIEPIGTLRNYVVKGGEQRLSTSVHFNLSAFTKSGAIHS